eukprot:GSA25T00025548001.1
MACSRDPKCESYVFHKSDAYVEVNKKVAAVNEELEAAASSSSGAGKPEKPHSYVPNCELFREKPPSADVQCMRAAKHHARDDATEAQDDKDIPQEDEEEEKNTEHEHHHEDNNNYCTLDDLEAGRVTKPFFMDGSGDDFVPHFDEATKSVTLGQQDRAAALSSGPAPGARRICRHTVRLMNSALNLHNLFEIGRTVSKPCALPVGNAGYRNLSLYQRQHQHKVLQDIARFTSTYPNTVCSFLPTRSVIPHAT